VNDNFETYAVYVIIVFGALVLGGLMAGALTFGGHDSFLFALGGTASAWIAGHALLFDKPRFYVFFVAVSVLLALCSTVALVR
jgi:hypothetical protein